jgi:hypothetical protein
MLSRSRRSGCFKGRTDQTVRSVANLRPGRDYHPKCVDRYNNRRLRGSAADVPPADFGFLYRPGRFTENTPQPNSTSDS